MSVTVRVALRVRPFNEKETRENNHNNLITFVPQQPQQIRIDQDRRHFTFDYVYPPDVSQADVYSSCIQPLFDQFIKGYNATILAYGQTGSGKTYSMGTSGSNQVIVDSSGIVPRFTDHLFRWIEAQSSNTTYQVKVSFLELYNEDINDLLSTKESCANISIREDANGNISWSGVHEQVVQGSADLLGRLHEGSISRTTASTDMNASSSRSHAIFTVTLVQTIVKTYNEETITKKLESKFHFVDLAGSERLKKTNAVGERAKEGISINSGLLALGNVISALGDESKRQQQHIPYRNSKLTRLLQDSLGGNSQTLMLACVSPAESNANETISTLKYANRAKNITNTIILNQEQSLTDTLKEEIVRLREEIQINDAFIKEVHVELDDLRTKNQALEHALQHGLPYVVETMGKMAGSSVQKQNRLSLKTSRIPKEDDEVTLIGSSGDQQLTKSTSTKRKRSKRVAAAAAAAAATISVPFSLDKHRNRIKKETLFLKQLKNNKNASSDPALFAKLVSLFQTSAKEQKQLLQYVEQDQTVPRMPSFAPVDKKKLSQLTKPSMIKQPTTFSNTNVAETSLDNQVLISHLKQIMSAVKKAIVMANNPSTTMAQLKPILNRAAHIYTQTTISSSTNNSTSTTTNVSKASRSKGSSLARDNGKRTINSKQKINIEDIRSDIQRIIAFEHIKSHPICIDMMNALKQKKIKLLREQKDLLKERTTMLKEFYQEEEFEEQQHMQQYMDERIDMITVQVDLITEHMKLLSASSIPSITNKNNQSLIDILKPLTEGDLRALILLIIQQELVSYMVQSQIHQHSMQILESFQQGIIQLRRTSAVMNNQILIDLLKSPVRCLSNGLILISGK